MRNPAYTPPAGLLGDKNFREGFAVLGRLGLSFDAWLFHPQIDELADLARAFPDNKIVLNHVGGPIGIGVYAGKHKEIFPGWAASIKRLAACANVFVKVGGLGMRIGGFGFHEQPEPPSSEMLVASWRPYMETCIEAFGAARCGHVNPPASTQIGSGTTVNLTVNVPAISTDGSIAVIKADPRIIVNYFEPGNDRTPVPKSGSGNGDDSEFSTSGENSAVEVLRIVNPRPGTWRVQLTSGPDVPTQQVSATVIWQGNVQSWVTVSPNQPEPSKPAPVVEYTAERVRKLQRRK